MKHLLILFFHVIILTNLIAQKDQNANQFWLSGGMGQSGSELFTDKGVVGGVAFSYSDKQHIMSLGINYIWETNMDDKMQGEFNEWKIQYGWIGTESRNQFYVLGGLAYTQCNHFREVFRGERTSFQKDWTKETAYGFVLETGVNYVLTDHIGLGLGTFVNFNKNALVASYKVNVLLGLFKKH